MTGSTSGLGRTDGAEMPEPTAELILMLAVTQSLAKSLRRKDRARFLENMADALGVQEASQNVLRFRRRPEDQPVFKAMREARAWWSRARCAISPTTD